MPTQTRKITIDTAALFTGKAVGLLLGVVRLSYLASYLGLSNFGVLNAAVYFTSLFQPLFDLGISSLLTRDIARDPANGNVLLGRALVLKLGLALAGSAVIGIAALVSGFNEVTNWAVFLTTAALAVNSIGTAYLSAFQARRRMVMVSVMNMFGDLLLSAGVILLLPLVPGVHTVLMMTVVVALLSLGVLVLSYGRLAGPPPLTIDRDTWTMLLREGFPIAVSSFGTSMYMFISPIVLTYSRGDAEVGIYSAGYKLISILTLVPVALTQVLFPLFSDFSANAPHKLSKALQDAVRVTAEISLPLAVGTLLLAPDIIHMLYPSAEYAGAATVLRLVITGNAFGYVAWILFIFLISIDQQRYCMWNALAVAGLVMAASLVVVPASGYRGAAAINGASEVVLFLSLFTHVRRSGYRILQGSSLLRILAATAVMGTVVAAVSAWGIFLAVPAGIVVYGIALYALGSYGDQEREILTRIFQR